MSASATRRSPAHGRPAGRELLRDQPAPPAARPELQRDRLRVPPERRLGRPPGGSARRLGDVQPGASLDRGQLGAPAGPAPERLAHARPAGGERDDDVLCGRLAGGAARRSLLPRGADVDQLQPLVHPRRAGQVGGVRRTPRTSTGSTTPPARCSRRRRSRRRWPACSGAESPSGTPSPPQASALPATSEARLRNASPARSRSPGAAGPRPWPATGSASSVEERDGESAVGQDRDRLEVHADVVADTRGGTGVPEPDRVAPLQYPVRCRRSRTSRRSRGRCRWRRSGHESLRLRRLPLCSRGSRSGRSRSRPGAGRVRGDAESTWNSPCGSTFCGSW